MTTGGGLSLVLDFSASLYMGLLDADGKTLARAVRPGARGETAHGELDALLAAAGAGPEDLAEVAIGIGPGSFTGIRVAVAMAQGLAFARRLPLLPFSSLAALRVCVPAAGGGPARVVAAIAANAGRYYVATASDGRDGDAGKAVGESLLEAHDLIALGAPDSLLAVSGPVPDRARLAAAFGSIRSQEEDCDFGLLLALARSRPAVRDGVIRPNYLLASAAEEKRLAAGDGRTGSPDTAGKSDQAPGPAEPGGGPPW